MARIRNTSSGAFGFRRGLGAGYGRSGILSLPTLGSASVPTGGGASYFGGGQISNANLQRTSGLLGATGLSQPAIPHLFSRPPGGFAIYATEPAKNAFDRYFGLRSTAVDEATPPTVPAASLMDALNANLDAHSVDLKARARRTFKDERYDAALTMFSGIRRMDRTAYIPSLLGFHAALMLDRHSLAIAHMYIVLERHPQLFSENEDISKYFGDPTKYEDQLHELVKLPDDSPPQDLVIKSYCAWRLGDKVTARRAIEKAVELSREQPGEPFIKLFSQAITPALR